jgi:hypothetical protein
MGLYIQLNELSIGPRNIEQIPKFIELLKEEEYSQTIKKNPYLYIINSYTERSSIDDNDCMKEIIEFIDLFGTAEVFKNHDSIFDSYIVGPYIHSYFYKQLRKNTIDSLLANLEIFKTHGIDTIDLLKFLLRENYHHYSNREVLNQLYRYNISLKDRDKERAFVILLIVIIYSSNVQKKPVSNDETLEFDSDFLAEIDNISKTRNLKTQLSEIIKKFNINDLEIKNLIKRKKDDLKNNFFDPIDVDINELS